MGFKLTIEVPVFIITFGFMLTMTVNNNLLIYRTCYVLLEYNRSECALLGFVSNNDTQRLEELVEPTATDIALAKTIVESVFGSLLCLFVAPWSDRYGRKPVLIMAFLGGTLSALLHVVFAAIDTLSPWYLLVITLPGVITGGGISFLTVLSAYLTDITSKEERGFRLGLFDVALALGILIGNTSSSYILIATNYVFVYCIATGCQAAALAYTALFVPESLQQRETESRLSSLFSLKNCKEMFETPFKRRENSNRALLMIILASMLLGFLTSGSLGISFYFLREKLHWTITQFTWFGTVTSTLGIFGTAFVVYFLHTKLKIQESVLVFAGSLFSVISLVILGFATQDWHIYLGAILNLPSSGQNTLMRSLISKLVHEEEIAKIFSAYSIGSSVISPLSSTGYTALYNATINTDPGLFNFVTALIYFCSSILFMVILIVQRKIPTAEYNTFRNNESEDYESCPENLGADEIVD